MLIDGNTVQVLIAFITGVLGPVLLQYVKTHLDKKSDKKDPIVQDIEYDTIVDEHLENLKEILDYDRVWISQFHNGGNFSYSGRSMHKFTMFYETVAPGVSATLGQFQNIPNSLFAKSLAELMKNGEYAIEDFEDEKKPTYGLKSVAETTGCQSIYVIGLKCPTSKKILGQLGVEHVKEKHVFTQQEKNQVKEISVFLAGVLTKQQSSRRWSS
jgi:hypothetical protein